MKINAYWHPHNLQTLSRKNINCSHRAINLPGESNERPFINNQMAILITTEKVLIIFVSQKLVSKIKVTAHCLLRGKTRDCPCHCLAHVCLFRKRFRQLSHWFRQIFATDPYTIIFETIKFLTHRMDRDPKTCVSNMPLLHNRMHLRSIALCFKSLVFPIWKRLTCEWFISMDEGRSGAFFLTSNGPVLYIICTKSMARGCSFPLPVWPVVVCVPNSFA